MLVPKFTELSDKDLGLQYSLQKAAVSFSVCSSGDTIPWILHEWIDWFFLACLSVSSSKREEAGKQRSSHEATPDPLPWLMIFAQHRERKPSVPFCSRQKGWQGCHCGLWCKSYTLHSICIIQTSSIPTTLPGRITLFFFFHTKWTSMLSEKNISMATDPSHAVEWLTQRS